MPRPTPNGHSQPQPPRGSSKTKPRTPEPLRGVSKNEPRSPDQGGPHRGSSKTKPHGPEPSRGVSKNEPRSPDQGGPHRGKTSPGLGYSYLCPVQTERRHARRPPLVGPRVIGPPRLRLRLKGVQGAVPCRGDLSNLGFRVYGPVSVIFHQD